MNKGTIIIGDIKNGLFSLSLRIIRGSEENTDNKTFDFLLLTCNNFISLLEKKKIQNTFVYTGK